jgi:hypothetical protein
MKKIAYFSFKFGLAGSRITRQHPDIRTMRYGLLNFLRDHLAGTDARSQPIPAIQRNPS